MNGGSFQSTSKPHQSTSTEPELEEVAQDQFALWRMQDDGGLCEPYMPPETTTTVITEETNLVDTAIQRRYCSPII